jgi:hypothetical protein
MSRLLMTIRTPGHTAEATVAIITTPPHIHARMWSTLARCHFFVFGSSFGFCHGIAASLALNIAFRNMCQVHNPVIKDGFPTKAQRRVSKRDTETYTLVVAEGTAHGIEGISGLAGASSDRANQ